MVNYKVRSFYEKDTGTAGADVIIYDDSGDVVDTLLITTESTYNDLVEQLEGIDEKYLDRTDVLNILQNTSNEIVAINATLLNGQSADFYAKYNHDHKDVYAPLNHVDRKGSEGLLGHVKVIDNVSKKSYVTGEALSAYQGKLLNDKINDVHSLLDSSTDWKFYGEGAASNGFWVKVEYNKTHARCIIHDPAQVSFNTSEMNYVNILPDLWIRPYKPVAAYIDFKRRLIVRDNSSWIVKQSSAPTTGTIYTQIDWTHRGVPKGL